MPLLSASSIGGDNEEGTPRLGLEAGNDVWLGRLAHDDVRRGAVA